MSYFNESVHLPGNKTQNPVIKVDSVSLDHGYVALLTEIDGNEETA
jgi:hypothetical protein